MNIQTAVALLPTPRATDGTKGGPGQRGSSGDLMLPSAVAELPRHWMPGHVQDWREYEPAIRRWEAVLGRDAPLPTIPNRKAKLGRSLSPAFVEWMMGLPAGHVTDIPGLTRNQLLQLLGNGVVPQQAGLALTVLAGR